VLKKTKKEKMKNREKFEWKDRQKRMKTEENRKAEIPI
jgi:hypothetical protein